MNPLVQLTDPSFQTQHSGKCDLHLEVLLSGMNFAIVDKGQDQLKILSGASHIGSNELKKYIEAEAVLSNHFRKVKVSFQTPQFTFIPDELFEKSELTEYAKFLKLNEGDQVFTNHIRAAKCVCVSAIPAELAKLFQEKFHQPQFYHAASALIEVGFKLARQSETPLMLLNLGPDHFEAVYIQDQKLVFYNILPAINADEFNYFLLHLLDSLSIDLQKTDWVLAGNDEEIVTCLRKYTDRVQMADKQDLLKLSDTFADLAPADFYSLTALALCE